VTFFVDGANVLIILSNNCYVLWLLTQAAITMAQNSPSWTL